MRFMPLMLILLLIITGCSPMEGKIKAEKKPECTSYSLRDPDEEKEAVLIVKKVNGVEEAAAVFLRAEGKLHVAVGLKVSNFNRLRLKGIRKEVYDALEKRYKDAKLHVTTDAKVYHEIETLQKKGSPKSKEESCRQYQDLKKIEKDMKG